MATGSARSPLLRRVIEAQGLRNLRERGRISEAEFLAALNEIRLAEGLPPLAPGEADDAVTPPYGPTDGLPV